MTIRILKNSLNKFALTNLLDRSIFTSRTYEFTFVNESTNDSQTLSLTPAIDVNVFEFQITEGTDITFSLDGSYIYTINEVNVTSNFLCEGNLRVVSSVVANPSPAYINQVTVYNG